MLQINNYLFTENKLINIKTVGEKSEEYFRVYYVKKNERFDFSNG